MTTLNVMLKLMLFYSNPWRCDKFKSVWIRIFYWRGRLCWIRAHHCGEMPDSYEMHVDEMPESRVTHYYQKGNSYKRVFVTLENWGTFQDDKRRNLNHFGQKSCMKIRKWWILNKDSQNFFKKKKMFFFIELRDLRHLYWKYAPLTAFHTFNAEVHIIATNRFYFMQPLRMQQLPISNLLQWKIPMFERFD